MATTQAGVVALCILLALLVGVAAAFFLVVGRSKPEEDGDSRAQGADDEASALRGASLAQNSLPAARRPLPTWPNAGTRRKSWSCKELVRVGGLTGGRRVKSCAGVQRRRNALQLRQPLPSTVKTPQVVVVTLMTTMTAMMERMVRHASRWVVLSTHTVERLATTPI